MKIINMFILCFSVPFIVTAQTRIPIDFDSYISEVKDKNIAYAAEKLNISIADAQITAEKVFNDPSLSFEYANNQDHDMQMGQGYSVELSKTISFGKRSARIDLSKSEKKLSEALLEDFFQNLRRDAAIAYLEAIKQTQLYEVKNSSYHSINDLAVGDSIRFANGKITETDALQSRLEANVLHNELLQAQSDLYNALLALNIPLGQFSADTLYIPAGEMNIKEHIFSEKEILSLAISNRADLAAALRNAEVAKKALILKRREKNMDLEVAVGYNYNTEVKNELAPAPPFNGMTVGISIPLSFSSLNKGSVKSSAFKVAQAEKTYRQAEIEVQNEVLSNFNTYSSLSSQVEKYNTGILENADAVLKGKIYSYNRGETSLLEVLNAQRTYNEVRASYIETLYLHAVSLVVLEKSMGIWDIDIR